MARAPGYKRHTRKSKHLMRRLRRTRHASVQEVMLHELGHEINRRWWNRRRPAKMPDLGALGRHRPLNHRAKKLLTQLRKAKVWRAQKQLLQELAKEIREGKRKLAERAKKAARRARKAAQRAQEKMLRNAERKQRERQNGQRGPSVPDRLRRRGRNAAGKTRSRLKSRLRKRGGTRKPQAQAPRTLTPPQGRLAPPRRPPQKAMVPAGRRRNDILGIHDRDRERARTRN